MLLFKASLELTVERDCIDWASVAIKQYMY